MRRVDWPRRPDGHVIWPTTDEGWCRYFRLLDECFDTEPRSPLHHDWRCPIHGRKWRVMLGQEAA